MKQFTMIFVVPEAQAKQIGGRYVCLYGDHEAEGWHIENTLFDLHKALANQSIDWPFVETTLREKGVWRSE